MSEIEIPLSYPPEWEEEYRCGYFPSAWQRDYPELFDGTLDGSEVCLRNTGTRGTLTEFCEYALMYLLRRDYGFCSLTYYELASSIYPSSPVGHRRKCRQETMRKWMSVSKFEALQEAIRLGIGGRFRGEPDLFCWNPDTRVWFFAEAKGKDQLTEWQPKWFQVCRETLPKVDIRVYRLTPQGRMG